MSGKVTNFEVLDLRQVKTKAKPKYILINRKLEFSSPGDAVILNYADKMSFSSGNFKDSLNSTPSCKVLVCSLHA